MQHALKHVERPGGSHEGVGWKKGGRGLVALGVPTIHQRSRYLAKAGFPALGRSAPQLAQCAPCTVLKAGIHMWERVFDQPRRHTGQLPGTEDSEQESIYVELLGLSCLLGGDLCSTSEDLTLEPILDGISLASPRWFTDPGIGWRLRGEGIPMRVLNSVTITYLCKILLFWVGIEVGPAPCRLSSSKAPDAICYGRDHLGHAHEPHHV